MKICLEQQYPFDKEKTRVVCYERLWSSLHWYKIYKVSKPLQTSILLFFFQPFDPLEINDGQPLAAKLRIMALLSELEKEMEEKFDRVCIQQFV